jgi:hypothetical protein
MLTIDADAPLRSFIIMLVEDIISDYDEHDEDSSKPDVFSFIDDVAFRPNKYYRKIFKTATTEDMKAYLIENGQGDAGSNQLSPTLTKRKDIIKATIDAILEDDEYRNHIYDNVQDPDERNIDDEETDTDSSEEIEYKYNLQMR